MNKNLDSAQTQTAIPPRLIPSFASGFNAVANHISLILLPVLLDLLLWFGPHLRLNTILYPVVLEAVQTVRETGTPQSIQMLSGVEVIWKAFLEHYNLLSSLSTFPLGIPSLMSSQAPLITPFGSSTIIELRSPLLIPLGWLLLTVLGFVLGSIYISFIARVCRTNMIKMDALPLRPYLLAWQAFQLFVLVIFLTILLTILFLPTIVISSILVLVNPVLGWIVLLGMGILTIWIIIPLAFSPHGIFAFRQNALNAVLNSARLVRLFLPGTGLFLLAAVIIYQGMSLLWHSPADNSWMALVGIAGHAFISTGLIASSFAYYFSALNWVQSMRQQGIMPGAK